jgi:hypothetical protein
MNKPSSPPEPQGNQSGWWNVSISSAIETLMGKMGKEPVPEVALAIHNREMMDTIVFAKTAQAIDNAKFTQHEFLLLIKIKYCLDRGLEEYAGLKQSVKYLQAAIEAKNSYLLLDQTELRYRSSKQQEFYRHIQDILDHHSDRQFFRNSVHNKLMETLPDVKSEEGKIALQDYEKEIDKLAEYELGLKLFSLFKAYQLADYSILRSISDMVISFKEKDTMNSKALALMVVDKFDIFEKLGKIIGLSAQQNTPENYAKMLQYIALEARHKKAYDQFQDLLSVMRKWYKPYQNIIRVRAEHPPDKYKQPKEFTEAIPGESLYEKYKNSLSDKRTGNTYFTLED